MKLIILHGYTHVILQKSDVMALLNMYMNGMVIELEELMASGISPEICEATIMSMMDLILHQESKTVNCCLKFHPMFPIKF